MNCVEGTQKVIAAGYSQRYCLRQHGFDEIIQRSRVASDSNLSSSRKDQQGLLGTQIGERGP
jgi:hypothetical protein